MSERAPSETAPPRWVLPAVLALAVALRLLAWHGAVVMTNDGPDFLWQADRLLHGDLHAALRHPYHPGYAAATAALALLLHDGLAAALAVSILSALGIVLAVRALTARAFPDRPWAAPAAALLAAVHGRLLITTSDIQSDGLFLALVALAFATLLAAAETGRDTPRAAPGAEAKARGVPRQRAHRGRLLLAGLLTGLAYLVRPEGLFVLAAALLVWLGALRGARERAGATAGLLVFLAGVLVGALPYVVALHELTGTWGLSLKPSIAAAGLGADPGAGPGAGTDAELLRAALPPGCPLASPKVFRAPSGALTAMPEVWETQADRGTARLAAPSPAPSPAPLPSPPAATAPSPALVSAPTDAEGATAAASPAEPARGPLACVLRAATVLFDALRADTALLALAGLALLARSRPGLCAAVVALLAGWLAVGALHWGLGQSLSARHMLVATALSLPLAGAGLAWLGATAGSWMRAGSRGGASRVAGVALGSALLLVALTHAAAGVRPRHAGGEARLSALEWARQHTTPAQRLAVQRRKDGYYSQRPVLEVDLPCFDAELREKLVRHDVALLVLDENRVREAAPHWLTDGAFTVQARFGTGDDAVLVLALAGW